MLDRRAPVPASFSTVGRARKPGNRAPGALQGLQSRFRCLFEWPFECRRRAGVVLETNGQVVQVAPGVGAINPLDPGPLWRELERLPARLQRQMCVKIHARRLITLTGLIELVFFEFR